MSYNRSTMTVDHKDVFAGIPWFSHMVKQFYTKCDPKHWNLLGSVAVSWKRRATHPGVPQWTRPHRKSPMEFEPSVSGGEHNTYCGNFCTRDFITVTFIYLWQFSFRRKQLQPYLFTSITSVARLSDVKCSIYTQRILRWLLYPWLRHCDFQLPLKI